MWCIRRAAVVVIVAAGAALVGVPPANAVSVDVACVPPSSDVISFNHNVAGNQSGAATDLLLCRLGQGDVPSVFTVGTFTVSSLTQ